MKIIFLSALAILMLAAVTPAQAAPDAAELTRLLNEFLNGASRNDAAIHDKFWADDLIYTRSAGARTDKAEIMRGVRSAPAPKPDDPKTTYTAEDVRIQQYGNTAIVAFRLVGTTIDEGRTQVSKFFNTGTFLKRKGKWQVAGWQSTRIPPAEEDAKKDVAAAQADFYRALFTADVKTLRRLTDESFIWVHAEGKQVARQQLLDDIASGQLKYLTLKTDKVTVSVIGETAVVRGVAERQRSAVPVAEGGGSDASPGTAFFTLTFVNRGGAWKAVALHTSRDCP